MFEAIQHLPMQGYNLGSTETNKSGFKSFSSRRQTLLPFLEVSNMAEFDRCPDTNTVNILR